MPTSSLHLSRNKGFTPGQDTWVCGRRELGAGLLDVEEEKEEAEGLDPQERGRKLGGDSLAILGILG